MTTQLATTFVPQHRQMAPQAHGVRPELHLTVESDHHSESDSWRKATVTDRRSRAMVYHPPFALLTLVLNEMSHGILLVTASAQVRFANRVALASLDSTQALLVDNDNLTARDPAENSQIQVALKACASGKRSMVTLAADTGQNITLAVVPLSCASDDGASDVTAMVALGRRQAFDPLALQFYVKTHDLTYSESNILQYLCEGFRPAEICSKNKLADSTIRTHIRNIRHKTQAKTIREMVSQVMMLPPMATSFGNVLDAANRFSLCR
jgi:DNA-binding CsgD family transcriptional regulator